MNTYSHSGDDMEFTAPGGGVTVDVPVLIGSLLVIPKVTAAATVRFAGVVSGVLEGAPKTTGTAWTEGQKLYWKVSTGKFITVATDGQLAGVAAADAASGDATGSVRLNGVAPDTAEGPQAAVTALVDNGGGTADGTVAAQAEPVTLTDSTGLSGTHDDTLAATTVPAAIAGGESPTEAEHNALRAVVEVMAQNASDTAQKIIELVTLAAVAQDNLKEVTTQVELLRARMEAYGVIAAA
jgi:predicted RecA/RadA family phage recombinase